VNPAPKTHRPISPLPRWSAIIFLAVCLGLIPQIVNLSSTLSETAIAAHWRTVWVGLDVVEALVFLATAWFLYRRSALVTVTASVAGTLLWLDAWFDVMTAFSDDDIATATNLAVFAEVPLGILCFIVALRTIGVLRRRDRTGETGSEEGSPPDAGD
jgi:hypothetical protein